MYSNITKPKSWSGQPLDTPHWTDDYEKKHQLSTYFNLPKLWGDPQFIPSKEAGTRFWNDPAPTGKEYTSGQQNKDISNELADPRFWSNIKGMLTGKSPAERTAAHKDLYEYPPHYGLPRNKTQTWPERLLRDERVPEDINQYYISKNLPVPRNIPEKWYQNDTNLRGYLSGLEGHRSQSQNLFNLLK